MDRRVFTSAHQAGMQETYEIMFTSGMWNDSSGERYEVLTEALVKIQSSGVRCSVTGQVVHEVARIIVSSPSGSSSPQTILISHLYSILSSIHSTSLLSLLTSQQSPQTLPLPSPVICHLLWPVTTLITNTYSTHAVCLHCYSSWHAWPRKRMNCDLFKCEELLAHW